MSKAVRNSTICNNHHPCNAKNYGNAAQYTIVTTGVGIDPGSAKKMGQRTRIYHKQVKVLTRDWLEGSRYGKQNLRSLSRCEIWNLPRMEIENMCCLTFSFMMLHSSQI
jgi:hypothetical protein